MRRKENICYFNVLALNWITGVFHRHRQALAGIYTQEAHDAERKTNFSSVSDKKNAYIYSSMNVE